MEYKEWLYIATDLDSSDELQDLAMLPATMDHDAAFERIQSKFTNNPIISITGNTWELEDIEPTGKVVDYNKQTGDIIVLHPREEAYNRDYPIMK